MASKQVTTLLFNTSFVKRIFCPLFSKLVGGKQYVKFLFANIVYKAETILHTFVALLSSYPFKAESLPHFANILPVSPKIESIPWEFGITKAANNSGIYSSPPHSL